MTKATENNYWISSTAISIALNAMGNREYIQCSVAAGSMVMCYMADIDGLGFDNGHNYRRWTLLAYPTYFTTQSEKLVYVAIPRPASAVASGYKTANQDYAIIVFPSEEIDLYGQNSAGTQVGDGAYYYIDLQGRISSSVSADREPTADIVTGTLSTDEASHAGLAEWYEYSTVTELVTFLKNITFKAGQKFIDFFTNTLKVYKTSEFDGKADFNDQVQMHSTLEVGNYADVKGFARIYGGDDEPLLNVGETEDQVHFGTFNKSVEGGMIDRNGDAELRNLVLRESLTVPKITYNCEEWIGGNTWRSQGGGVIKYVATVDNEDGTQTHYAILDIKADEGGKVRAGDKCQGIYHMREDAGQDPNDNATEDKDDHNGHFTFKGFATIYFLITKVYGNATDPKSEYYTTNDERKAIQEAFGAHSIPAYILNSDGEYIVNDDGENIINPDVYFRPEEIADMVDEAIELNGVIKFNTRAEVDKTYTSNILPQPQLNFAEYANEEQSSRQWVTLTTPQYEICLSGMTGWTYNHLNIQYIKGWLDGFSIDKQKWNSETREWEPNGTLKLEGMGIAFGNAYMWGHLTEFNRAPSLLTQQLYKKALAKSSGVTIDDIGTATDAQPTAELPYLWGYWKYTYSEGDPTYSDVFIVSYYSKAIQVLLMTDNGNVIKNGEGSTTITATVCLNGEEITPKNYQWYKGGVALAGQTENSLLVKAEDVTNTALFECEVEID